jgi:hypothetical protein
VNRTITGGSTSREEFHIKWRQVLDEMVIFSPELIIISAGEVILLNMAIVINLI